MEEKNVINIFNNYLKKESKWVNRFNKGTLPQAIEKALEILQEKEKYKCALFAIIKNNKVMPVGLKLGKSMDEINKMTYDTMQECLKMVDYKQIENIIKEFE